MLKEKTKFVSSAGGANCLGRSRKPEEEKKVTISINLKKKIVDQIEKDGPAKKVIEELVLKKYPDEN